MSHTGEFNRYTVRETSPQINLMHPEQPIYWHWSVEARSPEDAVRAIRAGKTGGYDQTVVTPLG